MAKLVGRPALARASRQRRVDHFLSLVQTLLRNARAFGEQSLNGFRRSRLSCGVLIAGSSNSAFSMNFSEPTMALLCSEVGGGGDVLRAHHPVDEDVGFLDVAGVARNREVVDEQPDAFLRIDVFEAGALGVGAVEGAVPLLVHGDLAGGHALDGAVAVVHGQRRLCPEQQVEDLLRFPGVLGAFVDAEVVGGGMNSSSMGSEPPPCLQLGWWFEERLPAFFQPAARHLRRIVAVAGGAPEIGNAVVVAGIEAKGPEVFLQISQARQLALVELLQQPS